MKIAIIQLSDIHLSSSGDWIVNRTKNFVAASKCVTNECQKVIVVIAGDILDKLRNTKRHQFFYINLKKS